MVNTPIFLLSGPIPDLGHRVFIPPDNGPTTQEAPRQEAPRRNDHSHPSHGVLASAFDSIRNVVTSPVVRIGYTLACAGFALHKLNDLYNLIWQEGYEAGHAAGTYEAAARIATGYLLDYANPDANPDERIEQIAHNVGTALATPGMSYSWHQPYTWHHLHC